MSKKTRFSLTIDEALLNAVRTRAAAGGKGQSEFIEDALRRELGFDLLERLWDRNQLSEDAAMSLALEAQRRR